MGPLGLAVAQPIGLVEPSCNLLPHGKSQFERHERDRLDKQFADGVIDSGSENALTYWVAEEPAAARAYISLSS